MAFKNCLMAFRTFASRYEQAGCRCSHWVRYLVLIFLSVMGFCGMFVYDIPGSLQNAIKHSYLISDFQFSLLYSLYSWPSVVVCFFGGFLIDKLFGVKFAATLFACIQIIGVGFFVLGGFLDILWLMFLGRFIFGIGGEMCAVCVNIFALMWFKGKELNTIFAIIQNTLRLGTSGVYLISTPLHKTLQNVMSSRDSLNYTILILCCATLIPLLLSILLTFINPKSKCKSDGESEQKIKKEIMEMNDIKISEFNSLPATFWILSISSNVFYYTLYTFLSFTQEFFTSKYDLSVNTANQVSSLFNIIPVALATLTGFLVDRFGRNMVFMIAAIFTGLTAHILAAARCSPYLIIVTFSISNSLMVGSILPTIAYTVNKNQHGSAYGVNQSMFNLISSCGALITGWVINTYGFLPVELYYIVCLCFVMLAYLTLWRLDRRTKNVLNMNPSQRSTYEERQ